MSEGAAYLNEELPRLTRHYPSSFPEPLEETCRAIRRSCERRPGLREQHRRRDGEDRSMNGLLGITQPYLFGAKGNDGSA
jgi:hypothetical protein